MADRYRTPTTGEPRADYAIRVQASSGAAPITAKSKSYVARVYREDPDGQKFDEHGVRIGRWERQPCGSDCIPNIFMAWCCPCVSAAQISHRMGGSFVSMLVGWGVFYVVMMVASLMIEPSTSATLRYKTLMGTTSLESVRSDEDDVHASVIVWSIVLVISWFAWLCTGMCLRSTVRARYQIPSVCCGDCVCMLLCSCCALSAIATHVKSYKPGTCDFGPSADALPGYDVDGPMKH